MKKSLVLMAMAGVALASCVNNEVVDVPQKEQEKVKITFDTPVLYDNAESRANFYGEIGSHTYVNTPGAPNYSPYPGTYSYPQEEQFVVFAKLHGDSHAWGDEDSYFWEDADGDKLASLTVSYDGENSATGHGVNGWRTEKDFLWPINKTLDFVAYSPADFSPQKNNGSGVEDGYADSGNITYTTSGWGITGFKVANSPEKHIDLLYSNVVSDVSGNTMGGNNKYHGVPIQFKHALSAIHFVVTKPETTETNIYLKKIELYNVGKKGNATQEQNKTTISWTVTDSPTYYTPQDIETQRTGEGAVVPAFTSYSEDSNFLAFDSGQGAHVGENGGHSLILLPQSLNNVYLYVEYYVGGTEQSNLRHKVVSLKNLKGFTDDYQENTIAAWEPGKKYIYVLKYSAGGRDMIYFNPMTEAWVDIDVVIALD